MAESRQFCTFLLGDLYLGIDVARVQEVLRYQAMTQVPLAPPVVRGLINLRGQIIVAVDLRRRLGLPDRTGALPANVVVRGADGPASLLVDEVDDVIAVDSSAFERPPDTLDAGTREILEGVYKLRTRLLLALDAERVLDLATKNDYRNLMGR